MLFRCYSYYIIKNVEEIKKVIAFILGVSIAVDVSVFFPDNKDDITREYGVLEFIR